MSRWCSTCRKSFEEFEGVEGEPNPQITLEDKAAWYDAFRRYCDTTLAYAVLSEIERGELPLPPSFDPIERLCPLPALEVKPSNN
jgi:hypothetical protein